MRDAGRDADASTAAGDRDQDRRARRHARVHGARTVPGRDDRRARRPVQLLRRAARGAVRSRPALAHLRRQQPMPETECRCARGERPGLAARDGARAAFARIGSTIRLDGRAALARWGAGDADAPARRVGRRRRSPSLLVASAAGGSRAAARIACAVPSDRLAAAWSGDDDDPRRQAIHRAFAASGRAAAETSWQRVSKILDDYVSQWSAMYVADLRSDPRPRRAVGRGARPADVVPGRNLDQVRALTNVLASADSDALGRSRGRRARV